MEGGEPQHPGWGGQTSRPRMSDVNCVYLIASVGARFTQEVLSDALGMGKAAKKKNTECNFASNFISLTWPRNSF